MTPYQRVSKQMVQMFGPQWTEKYGTKNEAWEEVLKELTYPQISAGLAKVMRGALKFYEIDLPRFLELCKPPAMPKRPEQMERPKEWDGLSEDEIQLHCKANLKLVVWSCNHADYGMNGTKKFTQRQKEALWKAAHRLSREFFEMREELGKDSVPDSDFFQALYRTWDRIVIEDET